MHFYVPATVESEIRSRAERAGIPVSRYIAQIVTREISSETGWPDGYFDEVFGGWKGEVLERPPQGEYETRQEL